MAFLPCSDIAECSNQEKPSINITTNHSDHAHTEEMCSPFCSCACCASHIFSFNYVQYVSGKIMFIEKKYDLNVAFYCNDIANNIWQPPRIC
jgi:hypothetical protein